MDQGSQYPGYYRVGLRKVYLPDSSIKKDKQKKRRLNMSIPSKTENNGKAYKAFRKEAIKLVRNSKLPVKQIAAELQVSPSTLWNWCNAELGPRVLKKIVARGNALRGPVKGSKHKRKDQMDLFASPTPRKGRTKRNPVKYSKVNPKTYVADTACVKVFLNKDGSFKAIDAGKSKVEVYKED